MKLRLLSLVALSALALSALPARADVSAPFLAEDVNPQRFVSQPTGVIEVVELADTTLLVLEGSDHESPETVLWRTDGTGDGTTPVPVPDIDFVISVHGPMANATKVVLFAGSGDRVTAALYATDGTAEGTMQLFSEGRPASTRYRPRAEAVDFLSHLPGSSELWRTDGTVAGTRRLGSFPFGGGDGLGLGPEAGPWAYFLDGGRLHRTDGTEAGTRSLGPDVEVHQTFETVGVFAFGDRAAFITDGLKEVWATDGTDVGTRRVFEAAGSNEFLLHDSPTASGDRLYFATHEGFTRRLWITDGTPAGTRRLAELTTSFLSGIPSELLPFNAFAPFGQRSLLFVGNTDAAGIEPWVSDGTVAGTRLLADLCDGPCHSMPDELSGTGFDAFFSADDGVRGREPYRTTGATATILGDLCAGPCPSEPRLAGHRAEELYFFAADETEGRELYHSTAGGAPAPLTAFELPEPFPRLAHPTFLTERGLYFTAFTREGATVFQAAGPSRSVEALMESPGSFPPADGSPSGFAAWQGNLFFVALSPEFDLTLYRKTPGELSRPLDVLVEDVRPFSPNSDAHESHVVGNRLFVLVNDGGFRGMWEELWVSDGAVGGATRLASELEIQAAWPTDDRLYFLNRVDGRYDLWVSDGSVAGTTRLREGIAEQRFDMVPRLLATPFDGDLLYTTGIDLWRVGSFANPTRWLDLGALGLTEARDLVAIDNRRIYFTAIQSGVRALFLSDGTAAGTRRVSLQGEEVRTVLGLLGQRLIFTSGHELMASGFIEADTRPLKVSPDPDPDPRTFGVLGDEMWLVGVFGEVFRTDGTAPGTARVEGIDDEDRIRHIFELPGHLLLRANDGRLYLAEEPGRPVRFLDTLDAMGVEIEAVDQRVYFGASKESVSDTGFELWALDVDGGTAPSPPPPPPPPPPQGHLLRPENVQAEGRSDGIFVRWDDTSNNETRFVVEARWWQEDRFEVIATVPVDRFSVELDRSDLRDGPYLFRVRAENGDGVSPWSEIATATIVGFTNVGCSSQGLFGPWLCLQDDRFGVAVYWHDPASGGTGRAQPIPFDFSDDSGAFWFFDENNVEVVVKVLDARVVNQRFWSFFGALSNVEYWVVVQDFEFESRSNVTYYNPPGEICGQADTSAFPRPLLRTAPSFSDVNEPRGPVTRSRTLDLGATGCVPDADTLCLTPDRYRVTVTWRDQRSGNTGIGHAIPGTSDSGYFWFFDPTNVELVVKVLDATPVNGFRWVFYGALTDVEYTLTVTDTVTGETKQYTNPPGNICGEADVRAF